MTINLNDIKLSKFEVLFNAEAHDAEVIRHEPFYCEINHELLFRTDKGIYLIKCDTNEIYPIKDLVTKKFVYYSNRVLLCQANN